MNVDQILSYKRDPEEDFYGLLGCAQSASSEQILAEFKARAKNCHPDKSQGQKQINFQQLLAAKNVLIDPERRQRYDAWLSASVAMSFKQWEAYKDSVRMSMHWATPRSSGRMLQMNDDNEPISLDASPVSEEVNGNPEADFDGDNDNQNEEEICYAPTPYHNLGYRVDTPSPDMMITGEEADSNNADDAASPTDVDPNTAMKRKQFATRRQSTIGALVMAEKWDDNEIRRRFRNYEI